jgi:hypothetical protein
MNFSLGAVLDLSLGTVLIIKVTIFTKRDLPNYLPQFASNVPSQYKTVAHEVAPILNRYIQMIQSQSKLCFR